MYELSTPGCIENVFIVRGTLMESQKIKLHAKNVKGTKITN
jgi:hypothetical protein